MDFVTLTGVVLWDLIQSESTCVHNVTILAARASRSRDTGGPIFKVGHVPLKGDLSFLCSDLT